MADVTPDIAAPLEATGDDHLYKFNVVMSCGGCSGAVTNKLKALQSACNLLTRPILFPRYFLTSSLTMHPSSSEKDLVRSFAVSLEDQTAFVVAAPEITLEAMQAEIAKTGKTVSVYKEAEKE